MGVKSLTGPPADGKGSAEKIAGCKKLPARFLSEENRRGGEGGRKGVEAFSGAQERKNYA